MMRQLCELNRTWVLIFIFQIFFKKGSEKLNDLHEVG